MIILGIETSCDETAAAVLEQKDGRIQILSNVVASSAALQSKYGGIIPEQAAREQLKSIIPIIEEALTQAMQLLSNTDKKTASLPSFITNSLDAIAVTYGPGLIGSLLVGVETAKVLAKIWNKPLIPINHLIGHFSANWIEVDREDLPKFPCLGLLVSGGHSDLVLFKNPNEFEYLGGTRDDAAGECFDKSARLIGYPYPGGPKISKIANKGNPKAYNLPRPMLDSKDFDFSFSGLKTAFANLIAEEFSVTSIDPENAQAHWKRIVLDENKLNENEQKLADLCASIEAAIIEVLVKKTIAAAKCYQVKQIIVAGGVAANQKLVSSLKQTINDERLTINLAVPPPSLCTDNAAMIASAGFFTETRTLPENLQANPNLSLAY